MQSARSPSRRSSSAPVWCRPECVRLLSVARQRLPCAFPRPVRGSAIARSRRMAPALVASTPRGMADQQRDAEAFLQLPDLHAERRFARRAIAPPRASCCRRRPPLRKYFELTQVPRAVSASVSQHRAKAHQAGAGQRAIPACSGIKAGGASWAFFFDAFSFRTEPGPTSLETAPDARLLGRNKIKIAACSRQRREPGMGGGHLFGWPRLGETGNAESRPRSARSHRSRDGGESAAPQISRSAPASGILAEAPALDERALIEIAADGEPGVVSSASFSQRMPGVMKQGAAR